MPDFTDFEANKILIYSNGVLISSDSTLSDGEIGAGMSAAAGSGTTTTDTTVIDGGVMYLDNGAKTVDVVVSGGGTVNAEAGALISGLEVTSGVFSGGGVCSGNTKWYGPGVCGTYGSMYLSGFNFSGNVAEELNGYAGLGGAVEANFGVLDINGGSFVGNAAQGSTGAGGGVCTMYTEVTVSGGAVFTSNTAFYGGGLQQNAGTMQMSGAVFSANSAGMGGALELHNGASTEVSDTEFTGNTASQGGAIYNDTYGSAVSDLTVSGGVFTSNTADDGGAVYNYAKMVISGAEFRENRTNSTEMWGTNGFGGAVENTSNGNLTITDATFAGNVGANGGAIANYLPWTDMTSLPKLTVSGGSFEENAAANGGAIYLAGAFAEEIEISDADFTSNTASYGGGAICNTYGGVAVSGGEFTSNTAANDGGAIAFWFGGSVSGAVFNSNTAANGGAISISWAGAAVAVSDCTFTSNTAENGGGAIWNSNSSEVVTVSDCTFNGNSSEAGGGAILNEKKMVLSGENVFATETDTIRNQGTLTLAGINTFGAAVDNTGGMVVIDLTAGAETAGLGNFSGGNYQIYLDTDLDYADTVLATDAADFTGAFSIRSGNRGASSGTAATGGSTLYYGNIYSLELSGENELLLNSEFSYAMNTVSVTGAYVLEISSDINFASSLRIGIASAKNIDTLALGMGTHYYRVTDGDETVDSGTITVENAAPDKSRMIAAEAGLGNAFFASADDVWSHSYVARHAGSLSGTKIADEFVSITNKNRFADVFSGLGSANANVLYLTDDDNGDALFLDDIYTAFPDLEEAQARVANISEIRAGAGNDVIDMTSQRFSGAAMTIRGGAGNDVIWGNSGENRLFGDEGNDRIIGGAGNDVIVGGAGNDTLNGFGGDDIFCFGGNWGNDTVLQDESGTVTLWFDSGSEDLWDAETRTYTADAGRTVTVLGTAEVTLKFGDDQSELYTELLALGAFQEYSTQNVYETDKEHTVIASL